MCDRQQIARSRSGHIEKILLIVIAAIEGVGVHVRNDDVVKLETFCGLDDRQNDPVPHLTSCFRNAVELMQAMTMERRSL